MPTAMGQVLEGSSQAITLQAGPLLSLRSQDCLPYHPESQALLFGCNPYPALDTVDLGSAGWLGTMIHTSTPSPKAVDVPELGTGCPKALGT